MKIQSIIFDLDGTLIDSIPDITVAANQMLDNYQYPQHTEVDYIRWIGNGALRLVEKAVPATTPASDIQNHLHEYLEIYTQRCTQNTKVYPGIQTLLAFLSENHISYSILTNKPHDVTQTVVNHYFPDGQFNFVFGQRPDVPKKPDPTMALEIAKKLNCLPNNMLFIGDSDTDMKTGKAAGMIPVGVSWGYDSVSSMKNSGSDYICNKSEDIISLITKLNKE